jgi:hypothetical protein
MFVRNLSGTFRSLERRVSVNGAVHVYAQFFEDVEGGSFAKIVYTPTGYGIYNLNHKAEKFYICFVEKSMCAKEIKDVQIGGKINVSSINEDSGFLSLKSGEVTRHKGDMKAADFGMIIAPQTVYLIPELIYDHSRTSRTRQTTE